MFWYPSHCSIYRPVKGGPGKGRLDKKRACSICRARHSEVAKCEGESSGGVRGVQSANRKKEEGPRDTGLELAGHQLTSELEVSGVAKREVMYVAGPAWRGEGGGGGGAGELRVDGDQPANWASKDREREETGNIARKVTEGETIRDPLVWRPLMQLQ